VVTAQRSCVGPAADGAWRVSRERILTPPDKPKPDHTWSDRGGYVGDFKLDANGFELPAAELAGLDPLFQWVLHSGREALEPVRHRDLARTGAVLGILGFPCAEMARFAEREWLRGSGLERGAAVDPRNRFQSGLPVLLLRKALGLGAGGFALDAACASSLYAIQFACERLHAGLADVMLAGAVNCADDLFIHVGFSALSALSKSGQSRPFHAQADGLVPAEGAGVVVLKRLDDAERAGDQIFGVIRGVGLSNDGRGKGFLVPSQSGQVRALREAYLRAELEPDQISLLECHATGTPIGDATELGGLGEVFGAPAQALPVGSLKSNLGHAITAAGVAGLIKLTEALRHEALPPSMPVGDPLSSLSAGGLRLLQSTEPWRPPSRVRDGVRRAGLSAFGFGGNNAHLVLEAHRPTRPAVVVPAQVTPPPMLAHAAQAPLLALVGVGVIAAGARGVEAFREAWFARAPKLSAALAAYGAGGAEEGRAGDIEIDIRAAGLPPSDLRQTLAQQLLLEQAAREALAQVKTLPAARCGVFAGMGTDSEVSRYGARWRLPERRAADGSVPSAAWLERAQGALIAELSSAGVLGTMPNMPANRLNRAFDLQGRSCTLSAEELSGLEALEVAARALQVGSLDAALVCAVDLCCEPVHRAAAAALLPADRQLPGDAAVALVLKRLSDAERDGDAVYAVFRADNAQPPRSLAPSHAPAGRAAAAAGHGVEPPELFGPDQAERSLTPLFGHSHAASGLLHWAAAALSVAAGRLPGGRAWLGERHAEVQVSALTGATWTGRLQAAPAASAAPELAGGWGAETPRLHVFRGASRAAILAQLDSVTARAGAQLARGPGSGVAAEAGSAAPGGACLVLVASDAVGLAARVQRAQRYLRSGAAAAPGAAGPGVYFREAPVLGDVAWVFTAAGAAYAGMGAGVLRAFPNLSRRVAERFQTLSDSLGWALDTSPAAPKPTSAQRLWAASALSQIHAELTLNVLGLKPQAAIGYSSGESNSLFAFGVWRDLDAMREDFAATGLFEREIGGEFAAVSRAWGAPASWAVWTVLAPLGRVRRLLEAEPRVRLAIIHHAGECVIAGEVAGCERVVAQIGAERCHPLEYNLAVHVPELEAVRESWLEVHRREVSPNPSVRIYSAAGCAAYTPSREACAQAIYQQARATLDFPRLIERAWQDGVRVFVEHGPGAACSGWIREILGARAAQAVIVPLDRKGAGAAPIFNAIAELIAAGISVAAGPWLAPEPGVWADASLAPTPGPRLVLPPHPPLVSWPPMEQSRPNQVMAPAPSLPSAIEPARASRVAPRAPARAAAAASAVAEAAPAAPSARVVSAALQDAAGLGALVQPAAATASSGLAPLAQVAQLHGAFLIQQAELHQRFMRLRSTLHDAMLQRATGAPLPRSTLPQGYAPAAPAALLAAPRAAPPAAPQGAGAAYSAPQAPLPPPPARAAAQSPAAQSPAPAAQIAAAQSPAAQSPAAQVAAPAAQVTRAAGQTGQSQAVDATPGVVARLAPRGIKLDREQLQIHASGNISEIYGPLFRQQDGYARQVRMPEPPLLLADRVTGIDAEPGVHGRGVLWTETDVTHDAWYLFRGRMPAGGMIESGQADLMLISYMGADFLNQGERVYRLLGCQLTYFGELPKAGETLEYEIHVDGHAKHGDVRLFFFHYECHVDGELRLRVEGGQAGFFTDQELAESAGIVWTPEGQEIVSQPRLDAPELPSTRSSFDAAQVQAFASGRPWECFGPGFEAAEPHSFTPRIQPKPLLFLDTVPVFDPQGGPWGRGYLRGEAPVSPDDWYFAGHFKNDPCMPGTLMFEGCVQALSFYLAALGFTLRRDGWRFQPLTEAPIDMRCRGQVTPTSKHLTYEVFVEELIAGPEPTVIADVLVCVDGHKAFHARRVGLKLVADWPMSATPRLLAEFEEPKPVASVRTAEGDFELGYHSLLACAWGPPTEAFGPMYKQYDGPMPVPRLPGPPYHFMSRILSVTGPMGEPKPGAHVDVEYDIPPNAWYFAENGARCMPFCVLLEAALQPCGWLASYVGGALGPTQVVFRNLDGTGTQYIEIVDTSGCLTTHVDCTKVSRSAGMTLLGFQVSCYIGETLAYDMETVFGFFPPEALANQVGLPVGDAERATLESPSSFTRDLSARSGPYYERSARLPGSKLDMLNRVTGYWPDGGAAGLGAMRAEKDVRPGDWYFKAHFFQDPVQPGSLGIEAMIQLLQLFMLEQRMDEGLREPRFEALAVGEPLTWKYRGQVAPRNKKVTVTLDITETGRDDSGPFVIAKSSLWCDGIRIYEAVNLGMRLVSGAAPSGGGEPGGGQEIYTGFAEVSAALAAAALPGAGVTAMDDSRRGAQAASRATSQADGLKLVLDPERDRWLSDHKPTYGRPALPMMFLVDLLARAVEQRVYPQKISAVSDVQLAGWVDFPLEGSAEQRSRRLEAEVSSVGERYVAQVFTRDPSGERRQVATAKVSVGAWRQPPEALPALAGDALPNPYASGALFHGPAFQLLLSGNRTETGASSTLTAGPLDLPEAQRVPRGLLHPALLDAGLHGIPHDRLDLWSSEIGADRVAYPARVLSLDVYGPTPSRGSVRCEVRFDGFLLKPDLPRFRLQWIGDAGVFCEMTLVEACFPKGRLGMLPALDRRAFLRDRRYVAGASLSRMSSRETRLSQAEADASDWMPGTLESIYGTRDAGRIAVNEHVGAREHVHPGLLPAGLPLTRPDVTVTLDGADVVVVDAPPSAQRLDLSAVRRYWSEALGVSDDWLGRDLWEGLIQRFVSRVVLTDPQGFQGVVGRPAIYVANHQVQMESLLVTNLLAALSQSSVVTMANSKHEQGWIGWVLRSLFSHPGCTDPRSIVYFDPTRPDSMFDILKDLKPRLVRGACSFFVHAQGTRSQSCRERTTKLSSLFIDLAAELGLPIVPIRFTGGLPVEPITGKLELPVGYGQQQYWIGQPISAAELGSLPYAQRKRCVLDAINALGVDPSLEQPSAPDPAFAGAVERCVAQTGTDELRAALFATLQQVVDPGLETQALLAGVERGELALPSTPSGQWLGHFARGLLGPDALRVRVA